METTTSTNVKPEISFDDFLKTDIRMCHITSVEKVEKSNKLYILKINTGIDERIVVSAIAEQFTAEQLIGRKMPFVLNLPTRKIFGIESFGMIIMSMGADGKYYELVNDVSETGASVI